MDDSTFIFKKWDNRFAYYALMKMEEDKICALKATWGKVRSKGVRVALSTTFGGGWSSVIKEAGKHSLEYESRKALGCITVVVYGYFGSASIVLLTKPKKIMKCAKVCHSACSGGLDMAELCAQAPMNLIEITIFGRPVIVEGQSFDLFSKAADTISDIENIFKK